MRNKFSIFSLLFSVVLLFFFVYIQNSFAAITVTTDPASIGKTSATFNATADTGQASEIYDGRGFNLGTASAVAGNYNMGSSTVIGAFTADDTFNHPTTTGLTRGTAYYFRAYTSS